MKKLLTVFLFSLLGVLGFAQPTPTTAVEATAAQVAAGVVGAPYYVSPRRLAGGGGPGVFSSVTDSSLTSGRVVFSTTGGLLTDDSDLTFATDTLTFTKGLTTSFGVSASAITPATELEVDSTSTSSPRGIMSAQFNTGTDGARLHMRKARGTRAAPTTVVTGDNLGRLVASGYDGSNYLEMGSIIFGSTGTIASTRVPTDIQFWTATDAAPSVLTECARFKANQALAFPSTNTSGLQIYNTVDQVANYQRLSEKYVSNIALIGTETGSTAASTPLYLFAQGLNAAGAYSRWDIMREAAFPLIRQGIFTTATGTTAFSTGITGTAISLLNLTSQATSGTFVGVSIVPTYNQASGTAANTDLLINRTETAVGSGAQYLIQAQVGSVDKFSVNSGGSVVGAGSCTFTSAGFFGTVGAGVNPSGITRLRVGGGISLGNWGVNGSMLQVTATTSTDTSTAGSGTAASAVFSSFAQPTLAATNSSVTTTNSATFYLAGPVIAGTNQTLTNTYSEWIATGSVRWGGYGAGALTTDANGVITAVSDARKKNIQREFTTGLEAIRGLTPKTYKWKPGFNLDTEHEYTGFISQNVKEFIPEAVGTDSEGYLTLADRPITAALVNAVKELDARTSGEDWPARILGCTALIVAIMAYRRKK